MRALVRGYSNILPKNEFPETALVPTHIKCSVYEHLFKMFKECSYRYGEAEAAKEAA